MLAGPSRFCVRAEAIARSTDCDLSLGKPSVSVMVSEGVSGEVLRTQRREKFLAIGRSL